MHKIAAIFYLLAAIGSAEGCLKYGASTTIEGTLQLRDEAGYNQFIAVKLARPICAIGNPKDTAYPGDDLEHKRTGVRDIQAGVYGSDSSSIALRDRLERLIGHRVVIKGDLFPATTGYHRTGVQLSVEAVEPADVGGQQALIAPKVPFRPKDVNAYDVTINAGPRLVIEAREYGSSAPLLPADQYAPHWMTGGEVLYVDCRDGYQRKLISTTEKGGGICLDGDLCGLSAFPNTGVLIKFRCNKRP